MGNQLYAKVLKKMFHAVKVPTHSYHSYDHSSIILVNVCKEAGWWVCPFFGSTQQWNSLIRLEKFSNDLLGGRDCNFDNS